MEFIEYGNMHTRNEYGKLNEAKLALTWALCKAVFQLDKLEEGQKSTLRAGTPEQFRPVETLFDGEIYPMAFD